MLPFFRRRPKPPSQQDRIEHLLNEANRKLDQLLRLEIIMSAAIDRIAASVATITSRADSLIELVTKIAQEVRDANSAGDPAINALADELDAQSAELAEAVDANTTPPPAA